MALQKWLQREARCHGLQLRSLIAEERPGTACRAVAVFRKSDDPEGCATAWPCRIGEELAPQSFKPSLSVIGRDTDLVSDLRDRGYGKSRTAKKGLNADIWRCACATPLFRIMRKS